MTTEQDLIDANKDHYAAIDLGIEVRAFLGSKIGKILVERAEEQREAALIDLVNMDATNINGIRELQSTIRRAESIQMWMAELIQSGLAAEEQLIKQDDSEGVQQ